MAESESIECPCSNIAIMQLFHELKQSYPTVPDQIVSKVIQENYHDKSACETILQRESHGFLQSYPGAIISGNPRDLPDRSSLCNQCPASRKFSNDITSSSESSTSSNTTQTRTRSLRKPENGFLLPKISNPSQKSDGGSNAPDINLTESGQKQKQSVEAAPTKAMEKSLSRDSKPEDPKENSCEFSGPEGKIVSEGFESSSLNSSRTCCSDCDIDRNSKSREDSLECGRPPSLTGASHGEVRSLTWNVADGGTSVVHNYQVAVQYSMQPGLPVRQGGQQRSFTTVNLSLRPPSSEPQPPIEIQSGQNLTYTTSVFDAKKGVQSQLQIRIGPGGGGTVSACRTYMSSPQTRFSCRSPCCTSTGFHCPNNHHLKALLEKQREKKDLLARELRKEKEKLRFMQNEVRVMKASIAQKPGPHVLPKLKSEIEKLRIEVNRLTAAVDLYSDTQNNIPLGETDEEFYRNIYTGQRLQREGSWSCQLCTFRNHPLLSVCEECGMPRISLGTQVMDVTSHLSVLSNNNNAFCTGGGTSTSASLITAPLQER